MTAFDRPAEWDAVTDADDQGRYSLGRWRAPEEATDGCTGIGCSECGSGCDRDYGDD